MLGNILKLGGTSAVIATYYYVSHNNRISLTNPYLAGLFGLVRQKKPQYALPLFKLLLSLNLLDRHPSLSNFILQAGFDTEGIYIQSIKNLGFRGIEIGPTSFNPSLEEDIDTHLGIMNAIANICSYKDKFRDEAFVIELSIAPNFEILKYTPYLMKENLVGALSHFIRMQQRCPYKLVDKINISFERSGSSLGESAQAHKMMAQVKQNAQQLLDSSQIRPTLTFTKAGKYMDWASLLNCIINKQIQ